MNGGFVRLATAMSAGIAAATVIAVGSLLVHGPGASLHAQTSTDGDWPFYGRDTGEPVVDVGRQPSLEVTPIVVDGVMYVSTPLGKVIALEPSTGRELWQFDAKVNPKGGFGDFANRGISTSFDSRASPEAACRRRLFFASVDARLIAVDAATGTPCRMFGNQGTLDLRNGLRISPYEPEAYEVTSPPAIVRDLVITGSGIADNGRPDPASGEVRAFDARTGSLRWRWDPIPQDRRDPAYVTWKNGSAQRTGAANVWSVIAADPARDLIFVPTSSPAPDYYGALRPGDNRYANSIVALRASTGKVVWHFQTVHHDLWDYDNASPPALVSIVRNGLSVPAVLHAACRDIIAGLRNEGIFTPPSLEGTLVVPSNIGGAHWGGLAVDEQRGIAVVPVNRLAAMVQLIPADGFDQNGAERESSRLGLGYEYTRMEGTPYVMRRRLLLGPGNAPCTPPPFGALVAVSLRTGERLWEAPLMPNLGGPIVTRGGLVFIAATLDRMIRAFDIESGRELWSGALPVAGKATPMTYEANGRQFVVIAAGGGNEFGTGDSIIAFALP